tara:strand:- start:16900 stop:17655 length:756 start_codon:yes stop_codon:yes gene_type:complete
MPDIKISQLPAFDNSETNSADSMPIVDSVGGITKRITLAQLDLRWQALPAGAVTGEFLLKTPTGYGWGFPTKSQVGLGNVDNTSDLNKPVSNATQLALNQKASITQLANKQDRLPTGSDGQVLTLSGGVPVWQNPSGGGGGGIVEIANQTLAGGAAISFTSASQQMVNLQSNGGALTLAPKAFGDGPWAGGEVRVLVGLSSTDYPIIETSDIEDGLISQGTLYLTKYTRSYWVYSLMQRRWFEVSRFTWNV